MAGDDVLIDTENVEIFLVKNRSLNGATDKCDDENQVSYFVGQYVHIIVHCKLTETALKRFNLKRPHSSALGSQPQFHHITPASPNLVANIKRQVCSSVDVACSVKVVGSDQLKHLSNGYDDNSPVLSTSKSTEEMGTEYTDEYYLSNDKMFFNFVMSVRIPHVSTCYRKAEICVNIKPMNKLAPRWLSSPSKPSSPDVDDGHIKLKGKTVTKKVNLKHPPQLTASYNNVGNGDFVFIKVQNTSLQSVKLEECYIHPDSCPKSLPGNQVCSGAMKTGAVCEAHKNMTNIVQNDSSLLPVMLHQGECLSLCYNMNVSLYEQSYTKEDVSLVASLKWITPSCHGNQKSLSSVITTYRLHNIKFRRGLFVVSATCDNKNIKKGESFTVTYTIHNRLQDFLSVKLHWKPTLPDDSNSEMIRSFKKLETYLICEDPCIQLGACQYGDIVQAKISFCALSTGFYEVCKHLKINLRYLIPGSDNTSLSSPTSLCSSVSDDHIMLTSSEYLWRSRSGSGSSYNDTHTYSMDDKRLSNKSFNIGEDRTPSETELFVKPRSDKSPVLPRRDPKLGVMSASKYEQMLLSPGNFIKNSCLIKVGY
ncbi:hypothetical protein ACF0H5_020632 [Mactra antiquata]